MTSEKFNELSKEFCDEILERLKVKGKEYGSDKDRLTHNFRLAAMTDLNPAEATYYEMAKHLVSLLDLCRNDWDICDNIKKWDEKLGDIIAYSLIIRAIVIEMGVK